MTYLWNALLGGVVGFAIAWIALAGSTSIDEAWKHLWVGLGLGILAGIAVAALWWRRR
jgi:hypothetical protein